MEYLTCEICREVFFLSEDAKLRHQQICLAVKSFLSSSTFASSGVRGGSTLKPSELSVRKRRSASPLLCSSPVKKKSTSDASTSTSSHPTSAPPSSPSPPQQPPSTQSTSKIEVKKKKKTTAGSTKSTAGRDHPKKPPPSGLKQKLSLLKKQITTSPANVAATAGLSSKLLDLAQQTGSTPSTSEAPTSHLSSAPSSSSKVDSPTSSSLTYRLKQGLSSARDYVIENPGQYMDIPPFLEDAVELASDLLKQELKEVGSVKYNIVLEAEYNHPSEDNSVFNFKTSSKIVSGGSGDLQELLIEDAKKLMAEENDLLEKNSSWSLESPSALTVRVSRLKFKATGKGYVELPKRLSRRKATINVKNTDDKCFKYAMLVKHLPVGELSEELTEQSFLRLDGVYSFERLNYPVSLKSISKFEKLNPNTSVNVFQSGPDCQLSPLRVVDEKPDHTDLLLYTNELGESHYMYISDFAKLIRPQISKGSNAIVICKRCSAYSETRRCKPDPKTWLEEHTRLCKSHDPTLVLLPSEGKNQIKFVEYETQIPVPIFVVADFESTLVPVVSTDGTYQVHEPNSFCTLVKSTYSREVLDEVNISLEPFEHRSENAGREFLLHLQELVKRVESLYSRNYPIAPLTEEQKEHHAQAAACELCEKSFNDANTVKCADHDPTIKENNYRYALCGSCNLRAQRVNFVPVYVHNLSSYDFFLVIKHLAVIPECDVNVIPITTEKYLAVSIRVGNMYIRLLDSYRMLPDSLAKLTETLSKDDFVESSKLVGPDHFDLITRKSVYPYDYITSVEVLNETSLPPREAFYNKLNDEHITDEDYAFALSVWNRLEMKTLGDYHSFYIRLDTTLLSDCLAAFRKTCLETYKIDFCHHYSGPSLAYQAMLRMTRVTIDLITDADQMLMIEEGVRGGLSQCSNRYVRANNPYLSCPSDYNPDEPISHILYKDANNLYGWGMTNALPTGNYQWVKDVDSLDWSTLPADSPHGYIMEASVSVPDSVHDKLKDLPLMPEKSVPPGGVAKKLIATLHDKKKYVAHYTVFQQAVELGLKVTEIHRAISFSQSPFMKRFVELNAELRAKSTNEFYRKTYKQISNSTFGRTLMNKRNHRTVKIVTTQQAFEKLCRQPHFADRVIISENVVAVHMHKRTVKMNSPIQIGMCILDISKVYMNNFYHNILSEHFKAPDFTLSLNYIDTDGIITYIVQHGSKSVIDVLRQPSLAQHLDQSCYPDGHPLRNLSNKGKIGLFKDEAKEGRQIFEFVGLRAKMYAYRYSSTEEDAKSTLKAKGIKTKYVNKHLTFDQYKNTLFTGVDAPEAHYNLIQSRNFTLKTKSVKKKTLTSNDDKRHILECKINSLPYGHYSLRQNSTTPTAEDSDSQDLE